jgi:tetratricopeptide (TPR) repeat protein
MSNSAMAHIWDVRRSPRELDSKTLKHEAKKHHTASVYLATGGAKHRAIKEDEEAIADDPNDAGYMILMGRLLTEKGKLNTALSWYQEARGRWPNDTEAIEELISGLQATIALSKLDWVKEAKIPDEDEVEDGQEKVVVHPVSAASHPGSSQTSSFHHPKGLGIFHRLLTERDDPMY